MNPRAKYILIGIAIILVFVAIFWRQLYVIGLQIKLRGEQAQLINELNPGARFAFAKFINEAKEQTGYDVFITSAGRPYDPLKDSFHAWGLALDINLFKGTTHVKKADTVQTWLATGVPQIAIENNLIWGGQFATPDNVHVRLTGYTIAQLEAAAQTFWGSEWQERNLSKLPLIIPGVNVAQA